MMNDNLDTLIQLALTEDYATNDLTSNTLLPQNAPACATLIAKESGFFYGVAILKAIANLNPNATLTGPIQDGEPVSPNQQLATLEGPIQFLLSHERVLLNFVQRLSGIASTTRQFVNALNNPNIQILDTRKTTPGFRTLEKQAVIAGGGHNHRHNLNDMILIKENHLKGFLAQNPASALGPFLDTLKTSHPNHLIEIEIESLDELKIYDLSAVDMILLDNFSIPNLTATLPYIRTQYPKAKIELSGNITLNTMTQYRNLDIDRLSIGCLTHSVKALDLSLLIR